LGVPVLYPDKAGLREQVGAAALLMDLRDPESLSTHLYHLITQPSLRAELVAAGHRQLSQINAIDRAVILANILKEFQHRRTPWR
jgi:hypothetical protein